MNIRNAINKYWPILMLLTVFVFFFHKTVFSGLIPFPGDLLVSEFKPWSTYSYLGYNPGSIPNKAQYADTIRQLYPWRKLAIDEFKSGRFPLWNPYNFSGSPLLANYQSAVFYPLNILFFIFVFNAAWTILVVIQPLLASLFTYLYCRRIGLGKPASLTAAITFGYSLFMSVFLEYNPICQAMLWLPLSLYAIEGLSSAINRRDLIVLTFSVVASAFAGHLQIFAVSLVFITAYWLSKIIPVRSKRITVQGNAIFGAAVILLSLGVCAIQFLPTLELISLSARVSQPYDFLVNALLVQPRQILMSFIPDLFGNPVTRNYFEAGAYPGRALYAGIVPLIFTAYLIFRKKYQEGPVRFYFIVSAVILLLIIR